VVLRPPVEFTVVHGEFFVRGISPLGQRKPLRTLVDESALTWPEIFVSAGRRRLELALTPADLLRLTQGTSAAIAR
jgi:Cys-tRNA(Pro)/Cys-tRNA(Cys) deacylase